MAVVDATSDTRAGRDVRRHLLGGALGVGLVLTLWGLTIVSDRLRAMVAQFIGVPGTLWLYTLLPAVFGVLVALSVLAARRLPMLPTVPAVALLYGVLQDGFGPLASAGLRLPALGPWQPRLSGVVGASPPWNSGVVALLAGVFVVAAVHGWSRPRA